MTTSARHDPSAELIDVLGTQRSGWPDDLGPELVAETVLAEIVGRAALFTGPVLPTEVQVELFHDDQRLDYHIVTGAGSISFGTGPAKDAPVRIRQQLSEVAGAMLGPAAPDRTATREIHTEQPAGPPSSDADDPTEVRLSMATAAAYQLVAAMSRRQLDLTELAVRFGSDKWGSHWYTPHYDRYFSHLRDQPVRLLEIGIGGYWEPKQGGASLRMWKHYFRRGLVHGLDVYDKQGLDEPRLRTHKGDQGDAEFLNGLADEIGPLDIVIDDGSHLNEHVLASFHALFPRVRPGGLYVIEDVQTAYWPGWGGLDSDAHDGSATSMGLVRTLIDGLHHQERTEPGAGAPTDTTVCGVHVHHNLVVIEKGGNTEQGAPAWVPRDRDPRTWLVPE